MVFDMTRPGSEPATYCMRDGRLPNIQPNEQCDNKADPIIQILLADIEIEILSKTTTNSSFIVNLFHFIPFCISSQ